MEFYTFAKKNYNKRTERMNTYEPKQRLERRTQLPFDFEQEQEQELYRNQPFYFEQEPKNFYYGEEPKSFYGNEFENFYNEQEPKNFYYGQEFQNFYKKRPFNYEQEENEELYQNQPFFYEHEPKSFYKNQPFYYEQVPKTFYKKQHYNCQKDQQQKLYKNQAFYYEQEPTTFFKRQPFEVEEEQRVPRKWYNVMYIKECRPEAIQIVVDPIYHTITVNGKRVIPLPRNVNVAELRVKVTPRGELLFKAPCYSRFVDTTDFKCFEKFTIPVIFSQKARSQKYQQRQQRQQRQQKYFQRFIVPQYFQRFFQQPEYFHVFKSTTTEEPKFVESRCERDETTGKFMVVFEVNTVGFRREEIQVRFVEEKHLLLVKAMHQLQRRETELKGIAPKTLLREFILPEWLEGSEMRYRVLKNGLLRIEVPCLCDHCPMTTERDQIKQQQLFQNFNFYKTF